MPDTDRDPRISDLIGFALDGKPVEFQNTFNDIVSDRLTVAVDARKTEVAQSVFSDAPAEEIEQEEDKDVEEPTGDTSNG